MLCKLLYNLERKNDRFKADADSILTGFLGKLDGHHSNTLVICKNGYEMSKIRNLFDMTRKTLDFDAL